MRAAADLPASPEKAALSRGNNAGISLRNHKPFRHKPRIINLISL